VSETKALEGEESTLRSAPDFEGRQDGIPVDLAEAFGAVRARTLALTAPLEIEDYGLQPMPDASPAKWHLAHTTWFFETFLLKPFAPGWQPVDARYEYLFNSYYNAVGEQFPRAHRGDLSRPTVREVLDYRARVDAAMVALLGGAGAAPEIAARTVLGLHHEEQHQELMLTDLKYAFGHNPLAPAYGAARPAPASVASPLGFTRFDGGLVEIGRALPEASPDRHAFVFDNETPRHRVYLEPWALADRCVSCGEFAEFMADGGYEAAALWLSDGWAWVQREGAPRAPLYWRRDGDAWLEYTLAGERPIDPHAPVTHVSLYEADAFARWAGARLPREAEWEAAASMLRPEPHDNFVETGVLQPVAGAVGGATGPRDLLGNQWEWTASPYAPYPGYAPAEGALGEYNGKFMCNQMVLRGGSCATPRAHARASYRNFFYPPDRWQFTGVRLARYC
jgi:ergothioneine biosynthesis protein EgtB